MAGLAALGVAAGASSAQAQPAFFQINGSPFATGSHPEGVAFNPDGGLLATANSNNQNLEEPGSVSVFSVGGGGLSPVSGSPFATPGRLTAAVAFSPSGGLLAVTGETSPSESVSVFSVGADGGLTPVGGAQFAYVSPTVRALAFSPSGGLLAVAGGANGSEVSVFSVGAGGELTPVSGSPFAIGEGQSEASIGFSPDGRLLAVASHDIDFTRSRVSVFSVGAGGALSPVSVSSVATPETANSVAFSQFGGLLAVADYYAPGGSVSVFSVGPGGELTEVSGSPFAAGNSARDIAFSPGGGLLAVSGGGSVSVLSVGPGGELTPLSGSPFTAGNVPFSVAFSLGGLLAATNEVDSMVSVFAPTVDVQAVDLVFASTGIGPGEALAHKADAIQTAVNAGDPATARADINDYLHLVRAQTGKKLTGAQAGRLTSLADNVATGLQSFT